MDKWLNIISELNFMYWFIGCFAFLELFKWIWTFGEWLVSKFGFETKSKKFQRENRERLLSAENDIKEIRETAKENVNSFLEHEKIMNENFLSIKDEIVQEIGKLHTKIDEHRVHLEEIDKDGKRRDCSLMRDRLIQGLRYFSQQKDENGVVHISMTDYENLNELFNEYFNCNGNGVCHSLYENEFKKFKIDTDRKY